MRTLYLSRMYTRYANASNNTPTYSHIRLYMVWRVHPLGLETCLPSLKKYKSTLVIDFLCCFTNAWELPKTHILVVVFTGAFRKWLSKIIWRQTSHGDYFSLKDTNNFFILCKKYLQTLDEFVCGFGSTGSHPPDSYKPNECGCRVCHLYMS